MSRTYRDHLDGEYIIHGYIVHWNDIPLGTYPAGMGFCYRMRIIRQRDRKPWGKPPKWFKQINRRWERSRVNQAMRSGRDIPFFKKGDRWDWT